MNPYSEGLRHGYEDQAKAIREILDLDVSDEEKLRMIRQRVEANAWIDRESVR